MSLNRRAFDEDLPKVGLIDMVTASPFPTSCSSDANHVYRTGVGVSLRGKLPLRLYIRALDESPQSDIFTWEEGEVDGQGLWVKKDTSIGGPDGNKIQVDLFKYIIHSSDEAWN